MRWLFSSGIIPYMEESENVLEISPLGKGRRALSFLADFSLAFILAISLFHLAVYPLGKLTVNYETRGQEYLVAKTERDSVLYGAKLLFPEAPSRTSSGDFNDNLQYTFKVYLFGLLSERGEVDVRYDNPDWDIFQTYYQTIRLGNAVTFYQNLDEGVFFSSYSPLKLKQGYEDEFIHAYIRGDEMGETGKSHYDDFQSRIFLKGFNQMLNSINESDLVVNGVSYKKSQQKVSDFVSLEKNLIIATSFIAYFLGNSIVMLLFPLLSKRRKTLSMIFMRYERLDSATLKTLKRRRVIPGYLYSLFFNMGSLFFIPLGLYDFISLFSLPVLLPFSAISLAYVLLSGIVLLLDGFNRTMADKLSLTVMVDEATLDNIFRAKGYQF